MWISVSESAEHVEKRGLLERCARDDSERIIRHVSDLLDRSLPVDLVDFYRERIHGLGQFRAQTPLWNDRVGWRSHADLVTALLHVEAVPLFDDGCGNLFGLDLTPGAEIPAVYFFDHERSFERPEYAAGSSLGAFLLLLAEHDQAIAENWAPRWELAIDPDINKCPRAPAIWEAD